MAAKPGRQAGRPAADDHDVVARALPRARLRITSIAWRPCSAALRIRPMPPSSPAMKMPGTLVSKSGSRRECRRRASRCRTPAVIASTGQAARQAPWPMQAAALTSTALPSTMPSASSGQAVTQDARADAAQRIDHRVQRRRLGQARPRATAAAAAHVRGGCVAAGARRATTHQRQRQRSSVDAARYGMRMRRAVAALRRRVQADDLGDLDLQAAGARRHRRRQALQVAGLRRGIAALADARADDHAAEPRQLELPASWPCCRRA